MKVYLNVVRGLPPQRKLGGEMNHDVKIDSPEPFDSSEYKSCQEIHWWKP